MSIFEYNEEEELKKLGRAEYRKGKMDGRAEGKEEGRAEGEAEGRMKGKAESVLLALEMKGSVPEQLRTRILAETDGPVLEEWLKAAIETDTIEGFREKNGLKENG